MRNDNKYKGKGYLKRLEGLLKSSSQNDSIEVVNNRISRDWIRENLGCGQNWVNQNSDALKIVEKFENKLRVEDKLNPQLKSPGVKDKEARLLLARADRLEQRNAQLIEDINKYKQKLFEFGWIESDEEESQQGKLPW